MDWGKLFVALLFAVPIGLLLGHVMSAVTNAIYERWFRG